MQEQSQQKLQNEKLKHLIDLPKGELEDEWIAYNIFDIIEFTTLFSKVLLNECHCDTMTGGPCYEYLWDVDGKQQSIPAVQYIQNVLQFSNQQLSDKSLFPIEPGMPFPKGFRKVCAQIVRRLLRIYIHGFLNHEEMLEQYHIKEHFNTCLFFVLEFGIRFSLLRHQDYEPIQLQTEYWNI